MKNVKGLTLVELIIVLAVIAIISAILVPNFMGATEKSRLKSDIQSARVLQNALELYNMEHSQPMDETNMEEIIKELGEAGYINAELAKEPQTDGASWVLKDGVVAVNLTGEGVSSEELEIILKQLSEAEQYYVQGGSAS